MTFSTTHLQPHFTKEELLEHVSPEQVFARMGIPLEEPGERFCSPFRRDEHPDCKVYYTKGSNSLRFYDPTMGLSLDWIALVMYAQQVEYQQALDWVAREFNLVASTGPTQEEKLAAALAMEVRKKAPSTTTIQIRSCPMSWQDLLWWKQFNVDEKLLFENRVWAISDYWLNGRHFYCPKGQLAFCYKEDDGYKLYFPEEQKKYKWRSTTRALSCYDQLPQTGELLVITSSKKDALCLMSFGYNAVAPQGEGVDIHSYTLWELKQRFKRVVLFYDNDFPGLQMAHQKYTQWQISDYVFLPFEEPAKDPAAYCQLYGPEQARQTFTTILCAQPSIPTKL